MAMTSLYWNSTLRASLELELPLRLIANDLTLEQIVTVDLPGTAESHGLQSAELKLFATNGFPFSAGLELDILDSLGNWLSSVPTQGIIASALLGGNGIVSSPVASRLSAQLDVSRTECYTTEENSGCALISIGGPTQHVQIYDTYRMTTGHCGAHYLVNGTNRTGLSYVSCSARCGRSTIPDPAKDSIVDLSARFNNRVELTGELDYNANSLLNELPLALLKGGYIDRVLRQRSLDAVRKKANDRAGYILSTRLSWSGQKGFLGHQKWRPLISLSHQDQMGLRFADDLFDITFFGNASFEGQRADLGPTSFKQLRFQTAGFGIQFSEATSYVRLDLVNGQSLTDIDAKWASLFTGEDGRVLRATINGKFLQSDTAGSAFGSSNGLGAAISGGWSSKLPRTERPITVSFEILNSVSFIERPCCELEKETVYFMTASA